MAWLPGSAYGESGEINGKPITHLCADVLPVAGDTGLPYIWVGAYPALLYKGEVMNSTTLSHPQPGSQDAGFWHATRVVLDVLLSPRHYLGQFDEVDHLLRRARRIESLEPQRAEALRRQAFDLIN